MYNIIGDVAGRYDELRELLKKMPPRKLIFVGDLIDRGPNSLDVVEYVEGTGSICVLGNHEHMMLDFFSGGKEYLENAWFENGGIKTYLEYAGHGKTLRRHLSFLENLPLKFEDENLIVTHAPTIHHSKMNKFQAVWYRQPSLKIPEGKVHVYGHNGMFRESKNSKGEITSICIDNSGVGKLMGMTWPEREYFSVSQRPRPSGRSRGYPEVPS